MGRKFKLTGAGTAPSCLIRGCERVPRKGTKLCRVHAEALRPVPPTPVVAGAARPTEERTETVISTTTTECIEFRCTASAGADGYYCDQHGAAVVALEQIPADQCAGCRVKLADDYREWFCPECNTAASKAF